MFLNRGFVFTVFLPLSIDIEWLSMFDEKAVFNSLISAEVQECLPFPLLEHCGCDVSDSSSACSLSFELHERVILVSSFHVFTAHFPFFFNR